MTDPARNLEFDEVWADDVLGKDTEIRALELLQKEKKNVKIAKRRLDDTQLLSLNLIEASSEKRIKRLNTDHVYRQRKYNLLHEISEGFAKASVLISSASVLRPKEVEASLLSLVGVYELDPNRLHDIQIKNASGIDKVEHLLGSRFLDFQEESGAQILETTVHLLMTGAITIDQLLVYLTPLTQLHLAENQAAMSALRSAELLSVKNLNASNGKSSEKIQDDDFSAEQSIEKKDNIKGIILLLATLISKRQWVLATHLFHLFESQGVVAAMYIPIRYALLHFLKWQLTAHDTSRWHLHPSLYTNNFEMFEATLFQLNVYIAHDANAMVLCFRFLRKNTHHTWAKRILRRILLPALTVAPCNPNTALEAWSTLSDMPWRDRFALYAAWRGRGLDKDGLESKHFELGRAECEANNQTRQILKRVANEKKVSKLTGRHLAKIAHANPFIVFNIILTQIESYDNMIIPLVEALNFMTPLALDVLAYMLPLRFADSSRSKLQADGKTLARWFQHLASFTGSFFRTYPMTELRGVLDFLVKSLKLPGNSLDLLILKEILSRMGGVDSLDNLSSAQLEALAGGEVLRFQLLVFDKINRRAMFRLFETLTEPHLTLPLVALTAHQCSLAMYFKRDDVVKLQSQFYDQCLTVFLQLAHFLVLGNKKFKKKYASLLPSSLSVLCQNLKMEPRFAMHYSRPAMAAAIDEALNSDSTDAWNPFGDALIKDISNILHDTDISPELYLKFWSLSLADIFVPTASYSSAINELKEKRRMYTSGDDKRKKEAMKCTTLIEQLQLELKSQESRHQFVRKNFKHSLCHNRSQLSEFLRLCVLPRLRLSPEDALYAAKFLYLLQDLGGLSILLCLDLTLTQTLPLLYVSTDREASSLGFFTRSILYPLLNLRKKSSPVYGISFDQYCVIFAKFHDRITNTIENCLSQYKDHGRTCLLVLIELVNVYPVFTKSLDLISTLIKPITTQQDQKDLQALALRYNQLLERGGPSLTYIYDTLSNRSAKLAPPQIKAGTSIL